MKTPAAARRIHFSDEDDNLLPETDCCFGKSLDVPTTHHPRISVVIAVDTAWIAYGWLMTLLSSSAPTVPNRYPIILTMIITDAVNSMLRFFLKQTSSAIVMVSMVSSSSSSMPAMRQLKATTACSKAKEWMIHCGFILEKADICLDLGVQR
jgi:hypothetical protein